MFLGHLQSPFNEVGLYRAFLVMDGSQNGRSSLHEPEYLYTTGKGYGKVKKYIFIIIFYGEKRQMIFAFFGIVRNTYG